jgi:hypothetical protein
MQPDVFAERLATVRQRFASTLEAKINEACAALPHLSGDDPAAVEKLAGIYHQIHGICGVGPTVGFAASGKAARRVEDILLPPFRAKRGLTTDETDGLQKELVALRVAAQTELQSLHSGD